MKNKKVLKHDSKKVGDDFFELLWEKSITYIKTVVDVAREPMLILDKNLKVIAANETFYETFNANKKETEDKILYKLGNGQWNIPILKKLLEDVGQKHTFFKGFQVAHEFPSIGRKVIILNARQIHIIDEGKSGKFPPIILLAMEDVTDIMVVAESLSKHASELETKMATRTQRLEIHIGKLEKEVSLLKKRKK